MEARYTVTLINSNHVVLKYIICTLYNNIAFTCNVLIEVEVGDRLPNFHIMKSVFPKYLGSWKSLLRCALWIFNIKIFNYVLTSPS